MQKKLLAVVLPPTFVLASCAAPAAPAPTTPAEAPVAPVASAPAAEPRASATPAPSTRARSWVPGPGYAPGLQTPTRVSYFRPYEVTVAQATVSPTSGDRLLTVDLLFTNRGQHPVAFRDILSAAAFQDGRALGPADYAPPANAPSVTDAAEVPPKATRTVRLLYVLSSSRSEVILEVRDIASLHEDVVLLHRVRPS